MSVCPNCHQPVETHEMFSPPRCPVVKLDVPFPMPILINENVPPGTMELHDEHGIVRRERLDL